MHTYISSSFKFGLEAKKISKCLLTRVLGREPKISVTRLFRSQTDNGVSPSSHIPPIIERLTDKKNMHLTQEGGVTQVLGQFSSQLPS